VQRRDLFYTIFKKIIRCVEGFFAPFGKLLAKFRQHDYHKDDRERARPLGSLNLPELLTSAGEGARETG
jgi:hypothetical protein